MNPARLIASGGCVGLVPIAPGTVASLVALLLGALLMRLPPYALSIAILLATIGGLWAIRSLHIDDDPGWVVIDEFAGQWVALLGLAQASVAGLLTAFVVFRILDVVKPGPIGWADRQSGAAGIMADDIIAGAITAGIVWAMRSRWPNMFDGFVAVTG